MTMFLLLLEHPLTTFIGLLVILIAMGSVRMAQEYQRAVIFRFGREKGVRGPGLFFKLPFVERAVFVDLRTITRQLDTQETITRDGVAIKANAVLWYHAINPVLTVTAVADWTEAIKQAAETAMRDTIGQNELDSLLNDRLKANADLKRLLDAAASKWGIQVTAVELKDLDIPENMQRAIAKEAEAIREKRARIIKADGELEAAGRLEKAAEIIARNPGAMELRKLQALSEIAVEHNSTIIMALPVSDVSAQAMALSKAISGNGQDK